MTQTAKRKLSEISFEHEGAHVALVSKEQQPANGHNYALVLKASKFSKETLEKMQSIKVTLSIPEFLEKFFNIYGTNAEVLARMLGYVPQKLNKKNTMMTGTRIMFSLNCSHSKLSNQHMKLRM